MRVLRSYGELKDATFEEMGKLVGMIQREVKRRNPIFVNAYTPYLEQAESALKELHVAELRNPSCEEGPDA